MSEHGATITPAQRTYRVYLGDELLVETDRVLELREHFGERTFPAVPYFDPNAVDLPLTPSDHTSACPLKGTATYFDLRGLNHAVWSYPAPHEAVNAIAGWLGFDTSLGFRIETV